MKNTFYCPLQEFGSLSLSGQDARTFLQGQVTCDVTHVSSTQGQAGAYCTPKGNVIANFDLLDFDATLMLHMPLSMVDSVKNAMAKYIVFSKAELTNSTDQWQRIALWGDQATDCLTLLEATIPDVRHSVSNFDGGFVWANNSATNEYIIYCNAQASDRVMGLLQDNASLADESVWQALQISQGLAYVCAETTDSYVPQMLNLQATGAINFKKGCYTGQEIVARMQYLGKLKRHLFIGQVTTTSPLEVGQQIDASKRKNVGKIISLAATGDNTYAFTAVINCNEAQEDQLHLQQDEDAGITMMPLPYEIDPQVFERVRL